MSPDNLQRALATYAWEDLPALPGRTNHVRAGVLVAIVWDPHPTVILTLRATDMSQHAGEVSFPGGRPEPGDADLQATALREAREEIGITEARVLGRLSSVPVYTSEHRLEPFVAEIPAGPFHLQPGEVAAIVRAPVRDILAAEHIDAIPWEWNGRRWCSPVFVLDGHVTFGATAHTLLELLRLMGEVPPFRTGRFQWPDVLGQTA